MSDPLVTVIMPSYNSECYIGESIRSIIAQTIENWELIVIDDASTDATPKIVTDFQSRDNRIRLIRHAVNRGAADARNLGLDHARGEFVAFIDSDDVWCPDKTDKQVTAMVRYGADISYTGYKRRSSGGFDGPVVQVPARVTYHSMLRRNQIACSSAMIRRSTCGNVRMPQISRRQDHGFWLALLRDGTRTAIAVRVPLMWYRIHSGSLSANKLIAARYTWQLLRKVERFSIGRSMWLFGGYAFEAAKLRLRLRIRM